MAWQLVRRLTATAHAGFILLTKRHMLQLYHCGWSEVVHFAVDTAAEGSNLNSGLHMLLSSWQREICCKGFGPGCLDDQRDGRGFFVLHRFAGGSSIRLLVSDPWAAWGAAWMTLCSLSRRPSVVRSTITMSGLIMCRSPGSVIPGWKI